MGAHGRGRFWKLRQPLVPAHGPWGHGDACQCDSDPAREYRAEADRAPPDQESAQGPSLVVQFLFSHASIQSFFLFLFC